MFLWMFQPPKTDELRLKPIYEVRLRLERRIDRDLAQASNDNRTDLFLRSRVGFEFDYDGWKGKAVYQVASDEAWTIDRNWMTERRDVVLAYAEKKVGEGTLTLGRQRLKLGSERLFGEANWSNVSTSYDAVRYKTADWEAFAGRLGASPRPRSSAQFAGGAVRHNGGETLVAFSHDSPSMRDQDRWIASHNQKITRGNASADFEAAGQVGRSSAGAVDGWALAGKVTYALNKKWSTYAEGQLATSDFDVLYGSPHARCGIMDLQGWRNAQNFGIGVKVKATPKVDVSAEWHALGLKDATDPWFNNAGAAYRRPGGSYVDPTGASGRDIGQEADIEAKWQAGHGFTVGAGIGIFRPGRFTRSLGGGGEQTFGYLEVSYKF